MIGFQSLFNWYPFITPFLTFSIAAITFLSYFGIGKLILTNFKNNIPMPWNYLSFLVLGIFFNSLFFQIVMFIGYDRLITIILFIIITVTGILLIIPNLSLKKVASIIQFKDHPFILSLIIIGLTINFLISISPSSKIDELAYMMYFTSRIIEDGSLEFYYTPWESSITINMLFQFLSIPFLP